MRSSPPRRRRSSPADDRAASDAYQAFAGDYHWLYDDTDLRLGTATPGVRAAVASLTPGARILDAACGIGVDAVALTRSGFEVVACDGSPDMVRVARARLTAGGLAVPVWRIRWADLPDRLAARRYDAVLCTGNAIAHAADEPAMTAALRAFAAMLRPGGIVALDTHDWEVVAERGDAVVDDPSVVDRNGERCRRTYRWSWADRPWTCTLGIDLEIRRGVQRELRSHTVHLHPFTARELRDRLRQAGFGDVGLDRRPDDDRYSAVGRAPIDG